MSILVMLRSRLDYFCGSAMKRSLCNESNNAADGNQPPAKVIATFDFMPLAPLESNFVRKESIMTEPLVLEIFSDFV
jgi:hypothetical protein